MASIYAARLMGTDGFQKIVAVKLMHNHLTKDSEFVKMFIDEAHLASRISHPNVIQILELGRWGTSHFIAMEFVEGESVMALMKRTKPPLGCCVQIIAQAAAGLHAAHELCDPNGRLLEVVHRDVSPDNILISYDGMVKVLDFGVARARDSLHTTIAGTLKGKFSYMAPEQARSQHVDRRADIFSLGIVLYEMTTCRRLFRKSSEADTLEAVLKCDIPPPSKRVPDYPSQLEEVVLKALKPNPDDRFQSAREFQEALHDCLGWSVARPAPTTLEKLMEKIFSDRIQSKRKLLRELRYVEGDYVPDIEDGSGGWVATCATSKGKRLNGSAKDSLKLDAAETPLDTLKKNRLSDLVRPKHWFGTALVICILALSGIGVWTMVGYLTREEASANEHVPITVVTPSDEDEPEISMTARTERPDAGITSRDSGKVSPVARKEVSPVARKEVSPGEKEPPEKSVKYSPKRGQRYRSRARSASRSKTRRRRARSTKKKKLGRNLLGDDEVMYNPYSQK